MAHLRCDFRSDAMGMNTSMTVILPEKTDLSQVPVVYLLHGLEDNCTGWARYTSVERYAREKNAALVMPEVQRSFYADMDKGISYFTFIHDELLEICRGFFGFSAKREKNYLMGLSMGGYGALLHGIENPDRYSAIGALSPAVFSKKDMESKKTKGPQWVDLYAATEKAVAEGKKLPDLFLSIGDRDFLYKNVQEYHKFVEPIWKSGRLRYDDLPGYEHEFAIWDLEINNFLDWIDRGDVYKKMGANKV